MFSKFPVYLQDGTTLYLQANTLNYNVVLDIQTDPFIVNDTDIPTWSFETLSINTGSVTPYWLYNQERFS